MARWSYKARSGFGGHPANAVDQGYMVNPRRNSVVAESYTFNSAKLTNQGGEDFFFLATDVSQDFSMGGSTGQSVDRRQFFPNNFNQPRATISGIAPSNQHYNELAEFVRETQLAAVTNVNWTTSTDQFITLTIPRGGIPTRQNQMKGEHGAQVMQGYIQSIQRGATRFEFAKEYSFEFVVSRYVSGFFQENAARVQQLLAVSGLLDKAQGSGNPGLFITGVVPDSSQQTAGRVGPDTGSDVQAGVIGRPPGERPT